MTPPILDSRRPSAYLEPSFCGRRAMKVLTGATLIDGTGAAPISNATVVVDGAMKVLKRGTDR